MSIRVELPQKVLYYSDTSGGADGVSGNKMVSDLESVVCGQFVSAQQCGRGGITMTLDGRDLWWTIGIAIVCSGLDKRGWSEPWSAALRGLVGA
ncbi:MAG: hypothetical protein WA232_14100, partial [Candidatus Sulfotelmatobacter sp.]